MSDLMNLAISREWTCEVCDNKPLFMFGNFIIWGLSWGIVHGQCTCDKCHAPYTMLPYDGFPKSLIKPEYKDVIKIIWNEEKKPVDEITEEDLTGVDL
jgi:hypothetical protein